VKRPIGTGPWKFVSRNVGTRIECEANPDKAAILAIDRQAVVKALLPPIASTIASLGALLAGGDWLRHERSHVILMTPKRHAACSRRWAICNPPMFYRLSP